MTGKRIKLASVLVTLMIVSVGCGKAEYESAMKTTKTRLDFASKFLQNLQPGETEVIPDVASLQLPLYINEEAQTYTITSKNRVGDRLAPGRIQPPFLNIPGFRYSYERQIEMGGRNETQPVYCYFGSVSAKEKKQTAILNTIKAQVGKALNGAVWQDAQLDNPEGDKVSVKKMSAKGSQAFEFDPSGGDTRKAAGQFDIYVHSTPDYHVIIAFRASEAAAQKVGMFFEAAEFAMGTLQVQAAEQAGDEADS